jgi:hypothetical protein
MSYYFLCFLFNKIGEQEGRIGSALKQRGWGEGNGGTRGRIGPNNVYAYE